MIPSFLETVKKMFRGQRERNTGAFLEKLFSEIFLCKVCQAVSFVFREEDFSLFAVGAGDRLADHSGNIDLRSALIGAFPIRIDRIRHDLANGLVSIFPPVGNNDFFPDSIISVCIVETIASRLRINHGAKVSEVAAFSCVLPLLYQQIHAALSSLIVIEHVFESKLHTLRVMIDRPTIPVLSFRFLRDHFILPRFEKL